jgi:hypothetical protein
MRKAFAVLAQRAMVERAFDAERFAELVVEECCHMMIELEVKYPANLVAREIKKHFELIGERA